ncbi:tRNA pseudouridine synthase D [Russula earlei]|uniref:tRNA pseudouridine synthase D n=1 Tax=Russula earlei TaxID=71964 RepID=A0ACC0UN05_9AGAM|nr:tRNA pseudouridine synthase D [Russula earlei]
MIQSTSHRSCGDESLDNTAEAPPSKRFKTDDTTEEPNYDQRPPDSACPAINDTILPPSHSLLETAPPLQDETGAIVRLMESDVGISEYIAKDVPKISGIIKQRFTDFLVHEVDQDSNVVHIKSLGMPEPPGKKTREVREPASTDVPSAEVSAIQDSSEVVLGTEAPSETLNKAGDASPEQASPTVPWPDLFTSRLTPFLSTEKIEEVKKMFLEGPEPPLVSDTGWSGRLAAKADESGISTSMEIERSVETRNEVEGKKGSNKRGRDRNGRGGRGGKPVREDHRKVISEPIISKETRTSFHQTVRELFEGKFDSETDMGESVTAGDGLRIVIHWARRGSGGVRGRGVQSRTERAPRGTYPPYIHFTLQKTNRDTQDALQYLARTLHVPVRDLSTAGTKDKRGVTVQRVSLWRGAKTVEDVWKLANGVPTRHNADDAVRERGERGVRIADLSYQKAALELGMLKGNAFVITLRNVQVDTIKTLDQAMKSIKERGFINYYGMQRFGTAAIPTHSIGLALLKSDWHLAVSLILRPRPGEHPDVLAARRAWLDDGDLDRALELFPRRVVAERCILESYKKQRGETRNALGALSTIPRNLRLMYVHAYQSYVWNAIVSERIKTWGTDKPVPGDLVLESGTVKQTTLGDGMDVDKGETNTQPDADVEESASGRKPNRKPWQAPRVKTLTEEDVDKYSIFDVVMPLPGNDVAFPGGALGNKYKEYLLRDGLDPDNFQRRQKDYTLSGSYRNILQLPKEISWSILRYTDPDVPLAQSDEDQLLGNDPPAPGPNGRFLALQIRLILGTAAYATMALREVTKTDTSSHFQTGLTQASEDQRFRGIEGDDLPMAGDEE